MTDTAPDALTTPALDDFELEFDEKAQEFVIYCKGGEVARAHLPPETVADAQQIKFTHITRQPLMVVYQVPVIVNDRALLETPDAHLPDLMARAVGDGVELLLQLLRTRRAGMRSRIHAVQQGRGNA